MSNRKALFHLRTLPSAVLALAAVGGSGSALAQANVTNGETLYKQKITFPVTGLVSCQDCHGPAFIFKRSAAQISAAIAGNRGGMNVYASWTAAQIGDIAAYMDAAMPPPPPPPPPAPSPPSLSRIELQGSNLHMVTAAQIRANGTWIPANVSNRLPDSLTLTPSSTLPIGVPMPVELVVPGQPNIHAGTVHVQNNGAIYLFGAEVAQVHSRQIDTATVRLTPGRPFLLRVPVLASSSLLPPAVTATVARNGVPVGTVTLTGPAVLSGTYNEYDNSTMFSAVIPGAWVAQGMQVTVNVATAPATQMTFTPQVGASTKLNVVLVPVHIGTLAPNMPDTVALQNTLARTYPVSAQDIIISTRSAMVLNLGTPLNDLGTDRILSELESRRLAEAPDKVYYGVVPRGAMQVVGIQTGGTLGQALSIPDLANASTWKLTGFGYDYALTWTGLDRFGLEWQEGTITLLHELGHLLSRRHAPCGGASFSDPNYPFKLQDNFDVLQGPGRIGPEPLYSSTYSDGMPGAIAPPHLPVSPPLYDTVHSRSPLRSNGRIVDIMGYCGGVWFSTYNYDHVQKFLERRTATMQASAAQARAQAQARAAAGRPEQRYLILSGIIGQFGVTLAPAQVLPFAPIAPQSGGPYSMAIRTVAGEVIKVDFAAPDVSHDEAKSFTVVLPDPGPVASVEVSKSLRAIPFAKASTRARAQSTTQVSAAKSAASVAWVLEGEHIAVRWNAAAEPFLGVTLVHRDGRRELIANELTGGDARVQTGVRPDGTLVELSVGSEFGARVIVAR